jgi:hypothetical protein
MPNSILFIFFTFCREEILDKKRKFIDDLPGRVVALKHATTDLHHQFDAASKLN